MMKLDEYPEAVAAREAVQKADAEVYRLELLAAGAQEAAEAANAVAGRIETEAGAARERAREAFLAGMEVIDGLAARHKEEGRC